MKKVLMLLAILFTAGANAHPLDTDLMAQIPAGSTLTMHVGFNVPPHFTMLPVQNGQRSLTPTTSLPLCKLNLREPSADDRNVKSRVFQLVSAEPGAITANWYKVIINITGDPAIESIECFDYNYRILTIGQLRNAITAAGMTLWMPGPRDVSYPVAPASYPLPREI